MHPLKKSLTTSILIFTALVLAETKASDWDEFVWLCEGEYQYENLRLEANPETEEGTVGQWKSIHGAVGDYPTKYRYMDRWDRKKYGYPYGIHKWSGQEGPDRTFSVVIFTAPVHNQPDSDGFVRGRAVVQKWFTDNWGVRKAGDSREEDLRCMAIGIPVPSPPEPRNESDDERVLWIN